MTEKIKRHLTTNTYRWYMGILLTLSSSMLGIILYFVIMLIDRIDYSYKFNVIQEQVNVRVQNDFNQIDEQFKEVKHEQTKQDTRQDILSERLYSIEALLKYKPQQANYQN